MKNKVYLYLCLATIEVDLSNDMCLAILELRGESFINFVQDSIALQDEVLRMMSAYAETNTNDTEKFDQLCPAAYEILNKARRFQALLFDEFQATIVAHQHSDFLSKTIKHLLNIMQLYEVKLNRHSLLDHYPGNLHQDSFRIHRWMRELKAFQETLLKMTAIRQELTSVISDFERDMMVIVRADVAEATIDIFLKCHEKELKDTFNRFLMLLSFISEIEMVRDQIKDIVAKANFDPTTSIAPPLVHVKKNEQVTTSDAKQPRYGSFNRKPHNTPLLFSQPASAALQNRSQSDIEDDHNNKRRKFARWDFKN